MNAKKLYLIIAPFLAMPFLTVTSQQIVKGPEVVRSVFFFKTKPVREMRIVLPGEHEKESRIAPNRFSKSKKSRPDMFEPVDKPILQKEQGHLTGRGPMLNIEGIGNINGIYPADPNGDIGLNHYVQTVNNSFAVWNKSGNLLYGPVDNKTIWASFPGPWNTYYWSDPVFKYDQIADRWIISSMSNPGNWQPPFYTMVAVSVTGDPLGEYYCYAFQFNEINDYPKLSVWPDGYYITYNFWDHITDLYLYTLYSVIDRDAMLNGTPDVNMIQFQVQDPGEGLFFPLPADLRGTITPVNTPCYFVRLGEPDPGNPWHLALDVLALDADWNVPENSTFIQVADFDLGQFEPVPYPYGPGAPQMGSDINVMTLPLLMMYPLTYRQFEDHESMVCCLTTRDSIIHYIKWYELRKDDNSWYMYQQGNYSPDSSHRYQPSITINGNGDIAMGYTVSDQETFPSIRMTGRRANDTLGVMTYQELELFTGLNYINTYDYNFGQNRWGDYASMMVDPANDSTFWFTNMYPKSHASSGNWGTRIFKIDLTEEFEDVTAFAGNDTMICHSGYVFNIQGEATNYNAIQWTTTGDGIFIIDNIPNSIYIRGSQDIANGQVQLIIQANGYEPDSVAVDTMTLIIDPCTGMGELNKTDLTLLIAPNPTNGIVTIQANVGINENVVLQVFNSPGKLIFTERTNSTSNKLERKLDFSYKESGVYYIRLQAEAQLASGKMVLMR